MTHVTNAQTGQSFKINEYGMHEMQANAFAAHNNLECSLLKAPPASGESRALMFIALYKLINQGIKKAIILIQELLIGSSFRKGSKTYYVLSEISNVN